MRPTPPRLAALAAAVLLLPAAARANAFALDIQGVYANGTAGAAAGDPRDPAVQFVNPAALAALDGTRVTAGGMLVFPAAPFTDAGSTTMLGLPVPGQNGDGATNGQAPWAFVSHRVAPSVTLGFGVTTPFGLATDFGQDAGFVGRYQGIESRIESVELGPSVGWYIGGRMAVGAALSARRDHVVQSLAIDMGSLCVATLAGGQPPDPDPVGTCASFGLVPGETDAYGRFEGEGWSWTTTVGATLEPVEGTTVGLGWRHELRGTVRGDETFTLPAGAAAFLAAVGTSGAFTGSPAGMTLKMPDFVTLHASHREGPVTILGALQWSRWKSFDEVVLLADSQETGLNVTSVQRYQNALRLALGAAWAVRTGLDLYGGVAYEQTPIQDAYRQATLPETDSIILGVGGEVALFAGLSLAAGWQHVEPTGRAAIDQVSELGDRVVGSARTRADLVLAQLTFRR